MKSVLFVTSKPDHRVIYERGLQEHYEVRFSSSPEGCGAQTDVVIYDIPGKHEPVDLRRLEEIDVPIIVMTPEEDLPVPETGKCRILTYPVHPDQLAEALRDLGLEADERRG